MGFIPEDQVLSGQGLDFGVMKRMIEDEERFVLQAMHHLLVSRGLCLRERRPRNEGTLLVFPSLFKVAKPKPEQTSPIVSYEFTGLLDEIYATLVVRLHHSDVVSKKDLWLDAADFSTASGKLIGIKMTRHGHGGGAIAVFCDTNVDDDIRLPFIQYVHEHLLERDPNVERVRHYACGNSKCGFPVRDPQIAKVALQRKRKSIRCSLCGCAIVLNDAIEQKFASEEVIGRVRAMRLHAQEVLDTESKGRLLVGDMTVIAAKAGQIFRELDPSDHGIDGEIEFKYEDGRASGKKLYVQLKSGDSYLRTLKNGVEVYDVDARHAWYWQQHAYDVMLVIRSSEGNVRWMNVTDYLRAHTRGNVLPKHVVFSGRTLDAGELKRVRRNVLNNR
jgi:hypothetical protein